MNIVDISIEEGLYLVDRILKQSSCNLLSVESELVLDFLDRVVFLELQIYLDCVWADAVVVRQFSIDLFL